MLKNIVILTGAGISAESGLGTFRDEDGLWAQHRIEDVATPEGFQRNPQLVYDFYNARLNGLIKAKPNAAHFALSKLETELKAKGGKLAIVTQNVDDLHEKAGSTHILHMHGELGKIRCDACNHVIDAKGKTLALDLGCGHCGHLGTMRPHVVWFGEMPFFMDEIYSALYEADLFVSIGTSGNVYPAAGFVSEAKASAIRTCEVNMEPSENAYAFDEAYYGPATLEVPKWVDHILSVEMHDNIDYKK